MTLKELRISKGLKQEECARILGMSTRNYQNYENNNDIVNSTKYLAVYEKIKNYDVNKFKNQHDLYKTNVLVGDSIIALCKSVKKYDKRDCFKQLNQCFLRSMLIISQ